MFVQSKIVYIVKENAGNASQIIDDLLKHNIFNYFYDDIDLNNKSFLKFISSLPQSTIFCINVNFSNTISSTKNTNIAIPFLSSHINFPVKLGEVVWFYEYQYNSNNTLEELSYSIDGYYLGRVHGLLNTEDSSYCFYDRNFHSYSPNRNDAIDGIIEQNQGILGVLESYEEFFDLTRDLIILPEIDCLTTYSNNILNSNYYKQEIKNLGLKSTNDLKINIEDTIIQGSHNTLIKLSSEFRNNSILEDKKNDFRIDSNPGKIEIISGVNEKLKENTFKFSDKLKTLDSTNYINFEGSNTNLYDNLPPDIDNGMFHERIKSSQQFVNPIQISEEYLDSLNQLYLENSFEKNIKNHHSSLIISDQGTENVSAKSSINFNIIPNISDNTKKRENNLSNVFVSKDEEVKKYITYLPEIFYENSHKNNEDSSITALSDNITLSVHENSSGNISLIHPSSKDTEGSYITLLNDGNIHINGQKIVIGSLNRLNKTKFNEHGENASLYLGHSSEMQSLVLGEQLKVFIEEILSIQKDSLSMIKDLFITSRKTDLSIKSTLDEINNSLIKFSTAFQAASSVSPLTAYSGAAESLVSDSSKIKNNVTQIQSDLESYQTKLNNFKIGNYSSGKQEEFLSRLESIENNLEKILSKFTKTS